MIYDIFPSTIYVKDYDLPQHWSDELKTILNTIVYNEKASGKSLNEIANNSLPLFTKENEKKFPYLAEVKEYFIQGFYTLAQHSDIPKELNLSLEGIRSKIAKETGKLPIAQPGSYQSTHNHIGAMAFGIFYLDDVDNKKDGGELILHDPSFNSNMGFACNPIHKIETKRNRLIIAPAHIWHSVSMFSGKSRSTIVINLNAF